MRKLSLIQLYPPWAKSEVEATVRNYSHLTFDLEADLLLVVDINSRRTLKLYFDVLAVGVNEKLPTPGKDCYLSVFKRIIDLTPFASNN